MIKKLVFISSSLFVLALLWITAKQGPSIDLLSLSHEKPKEFALFTMPKTGTHLMRPLLEHLTDKYSTSYWGVDLPKNYLYDKKMMSSLLLLPNVVQPYWLHQPIDKGLFISVLEDLADNNEFLVTHAPFSKEMESILKQRNGIVFFLIRDPRDWVVSVIRHPPISGIDIFGGPSGDRHFLSLTMDQKIEQIINGTSTYYSITEVYDKFLPWMKSPICCPLRFEALLGPRRGGYSEKEQMRELRKIANALHLEVSDEILLEAFEESFGVGTIFSKDKASSWKDYFKEEHIASFKEKFGDVLIGLGYESDYDW